MARRRTRCVRVGRNRNVINIKSISNVACRRRITGNGTPKVERRNARARNVRVQWIYNYRGLVSAGCRCRRTALGEGRDAKFGHLLFNVSRGSNFTFVRRTHRVSRRVLHIPFVFRKTDFRPRAKTLDEPPRDYYSNPAPRNGFVSSGASLCICP